MVTGVSLKEAFENNQLRLRSDILQENIELKEYGLEFYTLISKQKADYFTDAKQFFERTYFTRNIKAIVKDLLIRFSSETNEGIPVFLLDTSFGGGKTHTLICLYHYFKAFNEAIKIEELTGLTKEAIGTLKNPEVKVVGIDGHNMFVPTEPENPENVSSTGTRTLWGEIAQQLGSYELVEKNDKSLIPPQVEVIEQMLKQPNSPVLILLDELVVYLKNAEAVNVGKQTLKELALSFLHTLTVATKNLPRVSLVITMPGEEQAYKKESIELQAIKEQLKSLNVRQSHVITPIDKNEIYEVIKKQLFEYIDPEIAKEVSERLNNFYVKYVNFLPPAVESEQYRKKIQQTYPYHPSLIEVLYGRVSTIPQFQKTRGILRFLALLTRDVYEKITNGVENFNDSIITIGAIDLTNRKILNEIVNKIGQSAYSEALQTDIANDNGDAKTQVLDKTPRYGYYTRLATAIYLYTLIGSDNEEARGGTPHELTEAICLPSTLSPPNVNDAIEVLKKTLWYLHDNGGKYLFRTEPNLNKIIAEEAEHIQPNKVEEKIKEYLNQIWKNTKKFQVFVFRVPGEAEIRPSLYIPSPYSEHVTTTGHEAPLNIEKALKYLGNISKKPRQNKNLVFALVPSDQHIKRLLEEGARLLATDKIIKKRFHSLSKESQQAIKTIKKEIEESLVYQLIVAYSFVAYLKGTNTILKPVQQGQTSKTDNVEKQVIETLKQARKLVEILVPSYITDKVLTQTKTLTVKEVISKFWQDTRLPTPIHPQVIREAIKQGVEQGEFALYTREPLIDPTEITIDNYEEVARSFYYRRIVEALNDSHVVLSKGVAEEFRTKLEEVARKIREQRTRKAEVEIDVDHPLFRPTTKQKRKSEEEKIIVTAKKPEELSSIIDHVFMEANLQFQGDPTRTLDVIYPQLNMLNIHKSFSNKIVSSLIILAREKGKTKLRVEIIDMRLTELVQIISQWRQSIRLIQMDKDTELTVIITLKPETNSEIRIDNITVQRFEQLFSLQASSDKCVLRAKK